MRTLLLAAALMAASVPAPAALSAQERDSTNPSGRRAPPPQLADTTRVDSMQVPKPPADCPMQVAEANPPTRDRMPVITPGEGDSTAPA